MDFKGWCLRKVKAPESAPHRLLDNRTAFPDSLDAQRLGSKRGGGALPALAKWVGTLPQPAPNVCQGEAGGPLVADPGRACGVRNQMHVGLRHLERQPVALQCA